MAPDIPGLADLGWSAERAAAFMPHAAAGLVAGRVVSSGGALMAMTSSGLSMVVLQRRWHREAGSAAAGPAVGDWLALEPLSSSPPSAALREVLPRRGAFVRSRASDGQPQVLAANLDVAFLVSGLDHDLNPRRIERYLVLAMDGGVTPVVVLNKMDVAVDLERAVSDVHAVAPGTRVIVSSALSGAGVEELRSHLGPGVTACLLGSSGVGKSSLLNALLGEQRQSVQALRDDDSRGRHTTTRRELFLLTSGGMLIDTPGLRTVGVMGAAASLQTSFGDVSSLALQCRFPDCRHQAEPGCAVRAAIEAGTLSAERLASHRKLEVELRSVALRAEVRSQRAEDRRLGRLCRRAGKLSERYKRGEPDEPGEL